MCWCRTLHVKVRSLKSILFLRYLRLCNVLCIRNIWAIPTYKVYQPYDSYCIPVKVVARKLHPLLLCVGKGYMWTTKCLHMYGNETPRFNEHAKFVRLVLQCLVLVTPVHFCSYLEDYGSSRLQGGRAKQRYIVIVDLTQFAAM